MQYLLISAVKAHHCNPQRVLTWPGALTGTCACLLGLACDGACPESAVLLQGMGARERRDNLRRTWVPTGKELQRLEEERGIVIRFVIGYRWGCTLLCCSQGELSPAGIGERCLTAASRQL